jgi:hypothetical protein
MTDRTIDLYSLAGKFFRRENKLGPAPVWRMDDASRRAAINGRWQSDRRVTCGLYATSRSRRSCCRISMPRTISPVGCMRDAQAAEEVLQEAMLRALTYFPSFRGINPRGWLLQIVRNTAVFLDAP